jgi:hypothetical protein
LGTHRLETPFGGPDQIAVIRQPGSGTRNRVSRTAFPNRVRERGKKDLLRMYRELLFANDVDSLA